MQRAVAGDGRPHVCFFQGPEIGQIKCNALDPAAFFLWISNSKTMEQQPTTSTVSLTPEEVARLRENPENVVYEVVHDDVEYTPIADVKRTMGVIRGLASGIREQHADWDDDAVRAEIRARSAAAEKMASSTHPKLFATITAKTIDDRTATMIGFMMDLHSRRERGEISEEDTTSAFYAEMLRQNGIDA
ncbi:MAG: hypothetical protein CL450_07455 [Acidimicrobiaceae bacterium]|nr:hypothetical protein [Acidimicrobiaceae bacterium]